MRAHLRATVGSVVIIVAMVFTGCAATPFDLSGAKPIASSPTPTVDSTVEPAAEEPTAVTLEDVKALPAGTLLNDAQVKAMRGSWKDGVKAYKLESGETMLVQTREPLPEAVKKDAGVKLKAIDRPTGGSVDEQNQTIDTLIAASGRTAAATGKKVCAVMHVYYANQNGAGAVHQWVAGGCTAGGSPVPVSTSKSSVVAMAEAFVAKQPDASAWTVIVEP